MKKNKILHIAQSNGGVAEYLKMFFKYSDRNEFEIELLCSQGYEKEMDIFNDLADKATVINMERNISLFKDLKSIINILKYVRKNRPNLIHAHSTKAGVYARIVAFFYRIPVVYNSHGWAFTMNVSRKKIKLYVLIEKVLAKITDLIINISDSEQKHAIDYNIAKENRMRVVYNGVDLQRYSLDDYRCSLLNKYEIPQDSFIVGMVGRLTPQKDPITFINIAGKISSVIPNAYFILVGDGELKQQVEDRARELNVRDKLLITGWTDEVEKYISTFDVALLTSKWEGFGLVLAEYMAAGKPIVASDVGGIPNVIINNINGLLNHPGDVDGFTKSILNIKNNSELKKLLLENGKKIVRKKFDVKRVVKEHEQIYSEILVK